MSEPTDCGTPEFLRRRELSAENPTRERHIVGAEPIHSDLGETLHLRSVVDRPGYDAAAGGVRNGHEFTVNEGPLSPQVSCAYGLQGVQVIRGVADFEYAARNIWCNAPRFSNLPMVKRMHGPPNVRRHQGR